MSDVAEMKARGSDSGTRPSRRNGPGRMVSIGILVVLFSLLVPITVTAAWVHRTVLDTDTYISTIGPVASDPAVTAAAGRVITDQIYQTLDVQSAVANALPPKATVLAAPISNGVRDYVQKAVTDVLSSAAFKQLWIGANRFAHAQLVAALRGNSNVLQVTGGAVVLNLVPVLNAALQRAQGFISQVTGHQVSLPTITQNEIPSAACAKISAALDRPLPQTCGVIPLFRAKNLADARHAVKAFDRAVLALIIITPLLAAIAVFVSRRRRRTVLQLALGAAIGLVVVRRAVIWSQNQLIEAGRPENKDARSAIVHQLLSGFFDITVWLLVAALVVAAIALVTGPYRWAVRTREATRDALLVVRAAFSSGQRDPRTEAALAWTRAHFEVLRIGAVVVAVVLIAAINVNPITLLIILAVLALFEFGLHRLHSSTTPRIPGPRTGGGSPSTQT